MGIEWIILLLLLVEYSIFLPKIFVKAGEKDWKGYIPVYNLIVMIKVMKKPWWWILFMLSPGVNLLMLMAMNLELARTFNLFKPLDTLLAIFIPHAILPKIATGKDIVYTGPTDWTNEKQREIRKVSDMIVLALVSVGIFNAFIALYKLVGAKDKKGVKTIVKEWGDALLFAIVAASIIRTFFMEAFKIPTPSMEKNLLVGDFLFVSKVSYGPKIPQTPIAFPFVHHTLPLVETRSYLHLFELPYFRLPGLGKVERNDVVVFNFPCGDSVQLDKQNETFYQIVTDQAFKEFFEGGGFKFKNDSKKLYDEFEKVKTTLKKQYIQRQMDNGNLTVRPVDKEDHYIKRCVAIPGDTLKIIKGVLYINGKRSGDTPKMLYNYIVESEMDLGDQNVFKNMLKENFDVNLQSSQVGPRGFMAPFTNDQIGEIYTSYSKDKVHKMESLPGEYDTYVDRVDNVGNPYYSYYPTFPNDRSYNWTGDNFGPLWIPQAGATVKLTLKNLPLYRRIISVYEHNKLAVKGTDIYINDKKVSSYTFKQDYYWLMGDNRQNSLDSRYWGFVPEDHVVGKGVLVWFSSDPEAGVRWNRIFKSIE